MEISILQWNIWHKEKIENIAEFLNKNKADIICLQELSIASPNQVVADTPKYLGDKLDYNYFYKETPVKSTDGNELTLANGIFSRFPINSKSSSWIKESVSSGGYGDEYRAYIEVALKIGKKILEVGTTHMSYTDRFIDTPFKQEETDQLIKIHKTKKANYVFTGDLNSTPKSWTVKEISKYLKHAGPIFKLNTWTTKPFSYRGFEETDLNWRLDYVFTSNDIKVISSEILITNYSDHLPILTRIKIPRKVL